MHSRMLVYVLLAAVWVVFTAGIMYYQDRDQDTAGGHCEGDAEGSQPAREEFRTAA